LAKPKVPIKERDSARADRILFLDFLLEIFWQVLIFGFDLPANGHATSLITQGFWQFRL
jgi:hypothetical protein